MGANRDEEPTAELPVAIESSGFFRSLVENGSDAIITIDTTSKILYANQAVERIFGYEPEELIDEELTTLMPERFHRTHKNGFEQYLETGEQTIDWHSIELPAEDKDGNEIPLSITFEEHEYDGKRMFSGIMRDISDLRASQQELRSREQELRLLKQVFSRVFRHNIRNEATVLLGNLEEIKDKTDDETIRNRATCAEDATEKLLTHARKVREIERVVDDNPEASEHLLPDLVATAVNPFEEDQKVSIEEAVDRIPVKVIDRFPTAIKNAVDNAISHNPNPVTVEITSELDSETVDIVVRDNGDGVPESEISAIIAGEETVLSHGTGVGLWLMRWYVEKSNGKLSITTTDSGTEVRMTLPRAL